MPRRPSPVFTRPATWPAFRTTICSAPSSTAASPAQTAADYCAEIDLPAHRRGRCRGRAGARSAPTRREDGLTAHQMEFKTRRLVNDYLQPPKITAKFNIGQERASPKCARTSISSCARDPHELMRALETPIDPRLRRSGGRGLALSHREPLGPLSPARRTIPRPTTTTGSATACITRTPAAASPIAKREVAPYIVPVAADEMSAYRPSAHQDAGCGGVKRSRQCRSPTMQTSVPVIVDDEKCIAAQGLQGLRRGLPARRARDRRDARARPT